jgi:hypothetical protein
MDQTQTTPEIEKALADLDQIQTHLSQLMSDKEVDPESRARQLAQLDLDLEAVALVAGRSPKFFSLKAVVLNARGDMNGSVVNSLQGALLSIATDSVSTALKEGGEIKLIGPSALWSNMAVSLASLNLDMAVGASIIAVHLDPNDETAKGLLGQLLKAVAERSKVQLKEVSDETETASES